MSVLQFFFVLMTRRPPTATRTVTRFPYTTLCQSVGDLRHTMRHARTVRAGFSHGPCAGSGFGNPHEVAIPRLEAAQAGEREMHGVYTGVLVGRALQQFAAALFRERCVHVVGDRPLRALHRDPDVLAGVAGVEQTLVGRLSTR